MSTYLFFFLVFVPATLSSDYFDIRSVLCTESFCNKWIEQNPCKNLPNKCRVQNATHSGIITPSPAICNCCNFCLENLVEGNRCSAGGVGSGVPNSVCGPGLVCKAKKCVKMTGADGGACHIEMDAYLKAREDGVLGITQQAPDCEPNGLYEPFRCKPGETCFCVAKAGERIYGEIPYSTTAKYTSKCECSRKFHAMAQFFDAPIRPDQFFRCLQNGDFDPLQCIGDDCYCVSPLSGLPLDGDAKAVNVANVTQAPCFDDKIHLNNTFLKPCAAQYLEVALEIEKIRDDYDAVYEFRYPNCDLNGNYGPVQLDYKKKIAFCATPDGKQIEKYQDGIENAKNINCNCAKSKHLVSSANLEQLKCAANGNYEKIQCRRGLCFCVDENGFQTKLEVPIAEKDSLSCN